MDDENQNECGQEEMGSPRVRPNTGIQVYTNKDCKDTTTTTMVVHRRRHHVDLKVGSESGLNEKKNEMPSHLNKESRWSQEMTENGIN